MRRDRFLRLMLGGVAGAGLVGCGQGWGLNARQSPSQQVPSTQSPSTQSSSMTGLTQTDSSRRVLIIGAGIAGLAAARQLRSRGWDPVVLEGRDRVGGRLWSLRPSALKGVALDLGASWIHGIQGNPIAVLAQQWQIPTVATDAENQWLYDWDGRLVDNARHDRLEQVLGQLLAQQNRLREKRSTDRPLLADLQALVQRANLTADDERAVWMLLKGSIEHEYAGSMAELSANEWDAGDGFDGADVLFPTGYDSIARRLASGLTLQLNQVVRRIEHGQQGVKITTDRGDWVGIAAVVTLPIGVLQSGQVTFAPALPETHQSAINRLGMGILNKIYLEFPRSFWPSEPDWIGFVSDPPGLWNEWVNFQRVSDRPILLGFNAAQQGRELEALSDGQQAASALKALRRIFGPKIPDPTAVWVTRWGRDPFAGGSYSFLRVGATLSDRGQLTKPVADRLFFAGEATSRNHAATVHGAYRSGQRAADQIMAIHDGSA